MSSFGIFDDVVVSSSAKAVVIRGGSIPRRTADSPRPHPGRDAPHAQPDWGRPTPLPASCQTSSSRMTSITGPGTFTLTDTFSLELESRHSPVIVTGVYRTAPIGWVGSRGMSQAL